MRKFLSMASMASLIALALAPLAVADYPIKTSTGVEILMKSEVINGAHIPLVSQVQTTAPLPPILFEINPVFDSENLTNLTGAGPVTVAPAAEDGPVLIHITGATGMTSANSYWHSEDGETINAIPNAAYIEDGTINVIVVEPNGRDIITSQVQLQIADTGTASLYGTSNTAGMHVYAYNPMWPGERITLINYLNPNSIYEEGGTINSVVLNSILYQTYSVPVVKFIPSGWYIATEAAAEFSLSEHTVVIKAYGGTAPLILDGNDISNTLLTPIIYTGTNILENGEFDDWTDGEPDDWDYVGGVTNEQADGDDNYVSFLAQDAPAALAQNATLTVGQTYVFQITCRGPKLYLSNGEFVGATDRSVSFNTFSHRFVATTENQTMLVYSSAPYNTYDVSNVSLIAVD